MRSFVSRLAQSDAIPLILTFPALLAHSSLQTVDAVAYQVDVTIEQPLFVVTDCYTHLCEDILMWDTPSKPEILLQPIANYHPTEDINGGDPVALLLIAVIEAIEKEAD